MDRIGEKTSRRIDEIDFLKGIGILFIVIGHLPLPLKAIDFLFCFHIPLFIFASGIVFRSNHLKRNICSLLKCYVIYGIIMSAIFSMIFKSVHCFIVQMIHLLMGGISPSYKLDATPALWFLTCLIAIELLYFFAESIKINQWLYSIILVVIALFLNGYRTKIPMFFNIDIAFFLYPFYLVGNRYGLYILQQIKNIEKNLIKVLLSIILMILVGALSIKTGSINIYRAVYGSNLFLYYLAASLGIIGVCMLSCVRFKFKGIFLWLGKKTIIIMATHQLLIVYIDMYIPKISYIYLRCFCIFAVTMLFEMIFIFIRDNIKTRIYTKLN